MNKARILIGYSGHGLSLADWLLYDKQLLAGYCELSEKSSNPFSLLYLGSELQALDKLKLASCLLAIGDNKLRKKLAESLAEQALDFEPFVHSRAYFSQYAKIGEGSVVGPNAAVNACATIGIHSIINTSAVVEHECQLGDFVHISPNACLCGNVSVGDGSWIGAGAVIKQGVKIGSQCLIGAGAVVVSDVPDQSVFYGVPARVRGYSS